MKLRSFVSDEVAMMRVKTGRLEWFKVGDEVELVAGADKDNRCRVIHKGTEYEVNRVHLPGAGHRYVED